MVKEKNKADDMGAVVDKYKLSGKKLSQDEIDKIVMGYAKKD